MREEEKGRVGSDKWLVRLERAPSLLFTYLANNLIMIWHLIVNQGKSIIPWTSGVGPDQEAAISLTTSSGQHCNCFLAIHIHT